MQNVPEDGFLTPEECYSIVLENNQVINREGKEGKVQLKSQIESWY